MLKKLMKYDLEWIIGKVLTYYTAATILTAALSRLTSEFADRSVAWMVIDKVMLGLFFSAAVPLVINAFMRGIACLRRTLYGDPAYLTHTLPIERGTVFTAKILANIVSLLYSVVVALLAIAAVFLTHRGNWEAFKSLFQTPGAKVLAVLILMVFLLEFLFMQLCGVFGVVLGHRMEKSRIPFSILYAVLLYCVSSGVILGLTFLSSRFSPDMRVLFESRLTIQEALNVRGMQLEMGVVAVLYALLDSLLFFFAKRVFCKGVDVE